MAGDIDEDVTTEALDSEVWVAIKGMEGHYEVSNYGRLRSLDRVVFTKKGGVYLRKGRVRKLQSSAHGYPILLLSVNGQFINVRLHRLVAEHFCHKPEGCNVVNHIDNNPMNNYYKNLEWTNLLGNSEHAARQGRHNHGERNGKARLTREDVVDIHTMYAEGHSKEVISTKYNISTWHCKDILAGRRWVRVFKEVYPNKEPKRRADRRDTTHLIG